MDKHSLQGFSTYIKICILETYEYESLMNVLSAHNVDLM